MDLFFVFIILILLWGVVILINTQMASGTCKRARKINHEWYLYTRPLSVDQIFEYYNPFSVRNLFGLRSLFVPFKIPEKE
jgi:hypothetical protein